MTSIFLFTVLPVTRKYSRLGLHLLVKLMLIGGVSLALASYLGRFYDGGAFIGIYVLGLFLFGLIVKDDFTLVRRVVLKR